MSSSEDARSAAIVDVAITAYRRAAFIGEAIESVLDQRFDRWRLTICDNGPGGGEIEEIAATYLSDTRVSYLTTGDELPLAENWTKAIGCGRAPYVALLNDDDRWHPDFLGARVRALDAHPECGFAFAEWVQIDEGGKPVLRAPYRFPEGVVSRAELARWLTRQNVVVPPAIVVRRSGYAAVGAAFDGRWHYCDWEMWARLAARFPAYYLRLQDSDYRRHAQVNTFARREDPDRLVAMVDHLEGLFAAELPAFELSDRDRSRNRSKVLLHAAGDVYQGGGWTASRPLYRRALREYLPAAFDRVSLMLLARTVLGHRGSHVVGRALWPIRRWRRRNADRAGTERAA